MNFSEIVHPASANWNTFNRNPSGIRPPQPYLTFSDKIPYSSLPEPEPSKSYNLLKINSEREPYAVQHLVNGYGTLNMRLGTSMGSGK